MPIRCSKLAAVGDGADPSEIQPSELNIFAPPTGTPHEQDMWVVHDPGPPVTLTMYIYVGGMTYEFMVAQF